MNASRDWGRLLAGHALTALAAPGLGIILFMTISYGVSQLGHFGGVLAMAFGLVFGYILYTLKALLVVCLSSPIFWLLSKLHSPLHAYATSATAAALLAWFIGIRWFAGEEADFVRNAGIAAAITGGAAGTALAFSWRSSRRDGTT